MEAMEAMKFNQVMKYNMRKNFLKKAFKKYDGETIPSSFSTKQKLSTSLDQCDIVLYGLLLLCTKFRDVEIY